MSHLNKRPSNSCHICKQSFTDIPYTTCQLCGANYCSRLRCLNRLNTTWQELQIKLSNTEHCTHCISTIDSTKQCINTNCKNKRSRSQMSVQSDTITNNTPSNNNQHTSTGFKVVNKHKAGALKRYSSASTPIEPESQSQLATVLTRHTSEPYNYDTELDRILDTFSTLNSVQLYLTASKHPLFINTAIPLLIQEYDIPGHSLLTSISLQLMQRNNIPVDIQNRTMILISHLIHRQQLRLSSVQYKSPSYTNLAPTPYYTMYRNNSLPPFMPSMLSSSPIYQYITATNHITQQLPYMQSVQYIPSNSYPSSVTTPVINSVPPYHPISLLPINNNTGNENNRN